ncbi:hypothetical protein [Pseudooctadecabacter sp.]|uniref:hypothetical protein n=1 Tax=Pseudooctadecabacter sp. TaxID=1966338 RepID=UPI0035C82543
MLTLIRAKLEDTAKNEHDIYLDIWVNENQIAVARMPTYGFRGDGYDDEGVPRPTVSPFILQRDGTMDFGDLEDDPYEHEDDRVSWCNVFDGQHKIARGEYVSVSEEGEDATYRFVSCVEIAISR